MTELYMCVSSVVVFLAWHPVHLFHCLLFTVEVGRSSTGSFPAVLSPLGVAYYYLTVIWLYSLLCGRVSCLVYCMGIFKYDAYYRTVTDDPFWVYTSRPRCGR
jgi:hypothetical protein